MSDRDDAKTPFKGAYNPKHEKDIGLVGKEAGFIPTGDANAMPESTGQGKNGRHGRHFVVRTLIPLLVLAAILGGGYYWWSHLRPVQVTVNGTLQTVTVGTTIDQIKSGEGIETSPGNYVSVSGNVLAEGEGYPYSVTVNDKDMDYDEASSYKVAGGERISVSDGADKMEPYTTETVNQPPKLLMDGNVGAINYISQWGSTTVKDVRTGQDSGEQVDDTAYQQGQDCVITVKDVQPAGDQKLVALTFDDGPSGYTSKYLQILNDKGVKATFFCLGQRVDADPDDAKAIVDAGCQICSHSYDHPDLRASDAQTVLDQLTRSFSSIESATGVKTTAFRPPYGSFTQRTWLSTQGMATVAVRWDIDTEDWRQPGTGKIVSNACDNVHSGSIILMHDGGGNRDQDVEALPQIIDTLKSQGYTFVTISELLASDDSIPSDIASCDETMPSDAIWPDDIG
ncbi:MAG: polysaccharide deacetylase family protein [Olsenella sp.]|jgi:peptidoglycan/xylan/chitin deacetylase (PgdA/CDA1 family)|nr:polysaccharide deacetylase family protein [Olsenella sp.]MCI2127537.1 polysaccharide deacetylase family protein [Olsenella sp.]MCI2159862.1 polysaccharide deacetylase family protein [Olsenella sp.]MCI2187699.1 polysaccharide deacetylase family protein [Olsenella sp.]